MKTFHALHRAVAKRRAEHPRLSARLRFDLGLRRLMEGAPPKSILPARDVLRRRRARRNLFKSLSPEALEFILTYDGPVNFGRRDGPWLDE